MAALYAYMMWFQFWGTGKGTRMKNCICFAP